MFAEDMARRRSNRAPSKRVLKQQHFEMIALLQNARDIESHPSHRDDGRILRTECASESAKACAFLGGDGFPPGTEHITRPRLDFAHDQYLSVRHNEIELTLRAAPIPRDQSAPKRPIVRQGLLFPLDS